MASREVMPCPWPSRPIPRPFARTRAVRVGGTRVLLERIVYAFDDGASAGEIVERFPSVDLADVHATIAYILRHRDEIDAYMEEVEAKAEENLRRIASLAPQDGRREGLERRLSERR